MSAELELFSIWAADRAECRGGRGERIGSVAPDLDIETPDPPRRIRI
jgi:hypothetical protein